MNTRNESNPAPKKQKNSNNDCCLPLLDLSGCTAEGALIGLIIGLIIYLVSSFFLLLYEMYKDLQSLCMKPWSEWLYNPIFWKFAFELVIIAGVTALFLTNPIGLGMVALSSIACVVFTCVTIWSKRQRDNISNLDTDRNFQTQEGDASSTPRPKYALL